MAQPGSPTRRKPRFRERNLVEEVAPPAPRRAPPPPLPPTPARRPTRLPRSAPLPWVSREQILYIALIVGGFGVRIWDVGSRAMHGDEAEHAWFAWHIFTGAGYQYDPVYHGPLQFPVTALFYFLFGVSNVSARLMAVLFGSALIGLPYFLRREMGRVSALIASVFIAFSPAFVYVSRLERDDIFTSFFAFTIAISIFSYVRTRHVRYVYLGLASIALSLSAMENTYITMFVFGTYIGLVVGSEYLGRSSLGTKLRSLWRETGNAHRVAFPVLIGYAIVLLLAFALTVRTGSYVPVPLVLAIGLVALVNRQTILCAAETGDYPFSSALSEVSLLQWINGITIVVAILFLLFSTFGTNLRGIWDATQPLLNNGTACPGNNFPLNPCRKDILGGLFYWLSQHKVARGGQPWFYYSFLYGLYEQIAVIFGLGGIVYFLRRPTFFTTFLTYWAVLMFGVYSWAGEKFPWLTIHPLLPFLLIGAMFVGQLVTAIRPWKVVALAILGLAALLELHTAYVLNFVDGANPVEMMVYVQSSPDTPKVASDIQTLSNKATNGNGLHVTIDSLDSWPFAWYLRDMPNVAYPGSPQLLNSVYVHNPVIMVDQTDQPQLYPKIRTTYTGHEYRLRWWFPEDYKTLTWSSFARDAINPGYWHVITQWFLQRRPFGRRDAVWFYLYVKNGLVSPY